MVPLALQDEARRLVDGALDLLILMTRARAGAVFSCVSEPPRLALSLNLDDAALTAGLEVWSGQRHQLSAGLVFEHRRGLALACHDGSALIGYVYLDHVDGAARLVPADLATFARVIGQGLRRWPAAGALSAPPVLHRITPEALECERLLAALEESDWNVSRTARILGVTRVTVYKRIRRHGLEPRRSRAGVLTPRRQTS